MSIQRRFLLVAIGLCLMTTTTSIADQACESPHEVLRDLDVDEIGVILLYEMVLGDNWPMSITVRGTATDPIFDVVLGCDGGIPWAACINEDADEYQTFFETWADDGYRPMLVEVYGVYPDERYAAVMVQDGQAARGRHRVALGDLVSTINELQTQGYDPSWVSVCQGQSTFTQPRFSLVFEHRGATTVDRPRHRLSAAIPAADFSSIQKDDFQRAGDRLVSMASWQYANLPYVAATFIREVQPDWEVHFDQAEGVYDSAAEAFEAGAWEPTFVRTVDGGSGERVTSAWQFDPPRTWITTGNEVPSLAAFDNAMQSYMQARDATQGALAVTKDGRLVMARGYTWSADPAMHAVPTSPSQRFRLASVSKPFTSATLFSLLHKHSLSIADPIGGYLDLSDWNITVEGTTYDPVPDITIEHLLRMRAGWCNQDPLPWGEADVADELGLDLPMGHEQIMTYMGGLDPAHWPGEAPGDQYDYSNFSYFLLGRIIESISGLSYEEAVRQEVLNPLCITSMMIGESSHAPWPVEFRYVDPLRREVPSVMLAYRPFVPIASGGFNLNNNDASGGWVGSVVQMSRFVSAFTDELHPDILDFFTVAYMWNDPGDPPDGNCGSTCDCNTNSSCFGDRYGCGWTLRDVCTNPGSLPSYVYHTGGLPGIRTVIARFPDGVTVSAAVNTRVTERGNELAPGSGLDDNIRNMVASAWITVNSAGGNPWPDDSVWSDYLICGDVDGDGDVDIDDMKEVIGGWGDCGMAVCNGDLNGDGWVGIDDLLVVLGNWT